MTDLSDVRGQLHDYLERLGLHVEADHDGDIVATRRTALSQERATFRVVDRLPKRIPPDLRIIVTDAALLKDDRRDQARSAQTLDQFLDSTIQADRLARELIDDPQITRERQVFVPQHVHEGGQPQPDDAMHFLRTWFDDETARLLVVLAPAGYGKTLLTRMFAHRLATAHVASSANPLPFLLPFGQFRRVAEFEGMILSSIQRKGITDFTAAAFAYLVQRQRCVLMLDGFDELLEERPEEAQKNLRELIETLSGQGRIVLTARSTFFRTSTDVADFLQNYVSDDDVTVLDLQPFDASQRRQLVERLSPNQRVITSINKILDTDGLREAMGSPLLLRETVEALTDPQARKGLTAKSQRKDIFGVLGASVYARERVRHGHSFPDRVQRRFLELLAREMLQGNVRGFDMEGVQVVASEAAEQFDFEASPSDLARLADHHFLTVDRDSNEVRFNHQVFREYFQAAAIVSAVATGEGEWLVSLLAARPLPEEVATFVAEVEVPGFVAVLLDCVGPVSHGTTYYSRNVSALCAAFRSREAILALLGAIDPTVPLSVRIEETDLSATDWSGRIIENVEFVNCSLVDARFDRSRIRDIAFQGCDLRGASFHEALPRSLQFDYGPRVFGTTSISAELRGRGVTGLEDEEAVIADLEQDWRAYVQDMLSSRLRRFYVGGGDDTKGSRWDLAILEMNLLGGLDQFQRRFATSELIPALMTAGVLTRVREHGNVVYRLDDSAKDDARRLIEDDILGGTLSPVLERLAAR